MGRSTVQDGGKAMTQVSFSLAALSQLVNKWQEDVILYLPIAFIIPNPWLIYRFIFSGDYFANYLGIASISKTSVS